MIIRNLLLLAAIVLLMVVPLIVMPQSQFTGSDNQALDLITASTPGYHPWAEPLWTPPGSSMESLLFTLQAALGAGLLGYYIGRRSRARDRKQASHDANWQKPSHDAD